ncbi:hypothetical protein J6590_100416 [Homalodisca vitripennis]|nr:hypothetical protein J6590_100416 [Homalodisca vitripennis]
MEKFSEIARKSMLLLKPIHVKLLHYAWVRFDMSPQKHILSRLGSDDSCSPSTFSLSLGEPPVLFQKHSGLTISNQSGTQTVLLSCRLCCRLCH